MNSNVHYWIVCDALRFVREYGNEYERAAFQAWEWSYGGGDILTTPYMASRIEDIIGGEAFGTDYYHDMLFDSGSGYIPGHFAEYDGHHFTSMNHFTIAPYVATYWGWSDGYFYYNSAQTGFDNDAMVGKVDDKDIKVDRDDSLAVQRSRFNWTGAWGWDDNWDHELRNTLFVPGSTMADYYYWHLLKRYGEQLVVWGQRFSSICCMHLLGPIAHLTADACCPHHYIPTNDCYHQEWESAVEVWAYNWEIDNSPDLIRSLLDTHMVRYNYGGTGEMVNMLAIQFVIQGLCAWHSYRRFLECNSLASVQDMKSVNWWNGYMSDPARVKDQANYIYNLAVAATVRIMTESYYDLIATGGGSSPALRGINVYQLQGGPWARKRPKDVPIIHFSPTIPYVKPSKFLGFRRDEWRPFASLYDETRGVLQRWAAGIVATDDVIQQLSTFEAACSYQLSKALRERVIQQQPETYQFSPDVGKIRKAASLPDVSADMLGHPRFGIYSFRLPSLEEVGDATKFAGYLDASQKHKLAVRLMSLTRCIAFHRVILNEESDPRKRRVLQRNIDKYVRARDVMIRAKRIPIAEAPPLAANLTVPPIATELAMNGVVKAG